MTTGTAVIPPAPPLGRLRLAIFDIEGTTTSIAFVYEVLFPYARAAMATFLAERWGDDDVRAACATMGDGAEASPEAATRRALALMDGDVKDTGLKVLQGLIWARGYAEGAIRGHVFPDVPIAFAGLVARHVRIAIYSSGSVAAQKQIFGASVAGDLTPAIVGYFDTTTGPKKDAASYATIVAALDVLPAEAVFFTDNLDEARAARAAGLDVRVMTRPGNPPLAPGHGFEEWADFSVLAPPAGI